MSLPRHLLWDWNGTLFDDTAACVAAINVLLAERALPVLSIDDYRRRFGFPVKTFYLALGFQLEREDWDLLARRFHDLYLDHPGKQVRPEARAALAWADDRGIPQSLLSACEQGILDALLDRHALRRHFAQVCGSDNLHGQSKLEAGCALLPALGLPPDDVLLIGDTLHDHEVAQALGCRCLLIANGHQTAERLQSSGRAVLASLSELAAAVNE